MVWTEAMRLKRHPPMTDADYFVRFKARAKFNDGGCWLYQGHVNYKGYAEVFVRGKRYMLTRWAYGAHYGTEIPKNLQACHKCDIRNCFNPEHLFIGSNQDNCKDMAVKRRHQNNKKTHCPRGHEYSPENTGVHVDIYGWKHRRCLACERGRWSRERATGPTDEAT